MNMHRLFSIVLGTALLAPGAAFAQDYAIRISTSELTFNQALVYASRNFNATAYRNWESDPDTWFELHDAVIDVTPPVLPTYPAGKMKTTINHPPRSCQWLRDNLSANQDAGWLDWCGNYAQGAYGVRLDGFLGINFAANVTGDATAALEVPSERDCKRQLMRPHNGRGSFDYEACMRWEYGFVSANLSTDVFYDLFGIGKFIANIFYFEMPWGNTHGMSLDESIEDQLLGIDVAVAVAFADGFTDGDFQTASNDTAVQAWVPLNKVLGQTCGDWVCEGSETAGTCPRDCGADLYCSDGICSSSVGENSCTCRLDCGGTCCGDGLCEGSESSATCPADCDPAEY